MMISSVVVLREISLAVHRAAEFSAPDDQRVFEETSLLEVQHERRRCLIGVFALLADCCRQFGMLIPTAVEELRESDASFCHSTSEQAVVGKRAGHLRIFTVQLKNVIRL